MATSATGVLAPDDLNDTDTAVLDVLREGRVTPQYAADQMDVSRTYASERLKRLVEHKHVEKIAPGLYELVDDPCDDVGQEDVDAAALEERIEELEAQRDSVREWLAVAVEAIEKGDPEELKRNTRAAYEAVEGDDV